jgi:exonuclease SbcC
MKILAIRGKNLASLAGEFAIELDAPPLSEAGLFAICGPTGAGKSTILDALCLALYDRTPRLTDNGGAKIGHEGDDEKKKLSANDARALLTRGASAGYAEVDFRGRDGELHRARWSVRRARTGNLLDQELSLQTPSLGQVVGGKKREVLDAIRERVGLDFEQFRRSALLPQGDFAALLRAGPDERALLLEKMTGTEIYQRISELAFARDKEERQALELFRAEIEATVVLDDGARAELIERLAALGPARERERTSLDAMRRAVAKRDGRIAAEQEHQKAVAALDAALAVERSLFELSREVAFERAAAPVRAAALLHARAREALVEAEAAHRASSEARANAEAALGPAIAHASATAEAQAATARAASDAAPEIARARVVDAELQAATAVEAQAAADLAHARAAMDAANNAAAETRARSAAASAHAEAVERRVANAEPFRRLATEWSLYSAALERYVRAAEALRTVDVEAALVAREEASAAVEVARAAHEAATTREREAAERSLAARAAHSTVDRIAMRTKREHWEASSRALEEAKRVHADREALATERAALDDALLTRARAVTDAQGRIEAAERARDRATIEVQTAERAIDRARRAADFADHRATLVDGEPCPLCGALEHPWAVAGAAPIFDALGEELSAARARGEQAASAASEARAALAMHQEFVREAAARRKALDGRGAELSLRWTKVVGALGLAHHGEVAAALSARASALEAERASLDAAERASDAAERAAMEAQELERARRQETEASREQLALRERAAVEAGATYERRVASADEHARVMREAVAELAPALDATGAWREQLAESPTKFADRQARIVAEWRSVALQRDEAARALVDAETAAALAEEKRAALAETEARAASKHALAETERSAIATERAGLLGGEPTDRVEARWLERTRAAEAIAIEAQQARIEVERRLELSRADEQARMRDVESAAKAEASSRAARDEAANRAGITLESLADRPARPAGWLEGAEAELLAASRAIDAARAVLRDREARLVALAPGDDEATPDDLDAALAEAEARYDATVREEATVRARLDDDDRAREKRGERGRELEERRARATCWAALNDLIGSQNGKKLRLFAQSLTFDARVAEANVHLAELARRYSLARVPGTELELQIIDHDLGDDVRATTSLSGGESFLVSLALALGLSSLGSDRTRVETLFIDEGFGTLDPDALDLAIGTLEALQSTGRQVGVISHVPGLAERLGARVRVERRGPGRSFIRVERG